MVDTTPDTGDQGTDKNYSPTKKYSFCRADRVWEQFSMR